VCTVGSVGSAVCTVSDRRGCCSLCRHKVWKVRCPKHKERESDHAVSTRTTIQLAQVVSNNARTAPDRGCQPRQLDQVEPGRQSCSVVHLGYEPDGCPAITSILSRLTCNGLMKRTRFASVENTLRVLTSPREVRAS
jgi:hypothetical protein